MDRRVFLLGSTTVALMAAVPSPASAGNGPFSAEVERVAADRLHVTWQNAGGRVAVLASTDPDAPESLMRTLATRRGPLTVDLPATPRPYFLLQSKAGAVRAAERLLPLEGGRNFRDLGGYLGADGRQVKWGLIYRSGVMAGLTPADLTYLSDLGVETVCDLRSTTERTREPMPFAPEALTILSAEYELDYSDMAGIIQATSREQAITEFANGYINFASALKPQYTEMFRTLVNRKAPLAFNCSAGKDRTGLAAALILSVLGVSRETIVADYALSETYVPVETYLAAFQGEGEAKSTIGSAEQKMFSQMPEATMRVLLGTPAEVMEQTLARIDREHGSPVDFVQRQYGVTDSDIGLMRGHYLYG